MLVHDVEERGVQVLRAQVHQGSCQAHLSPVMPATPGLLGPLPFCSRLVSSQYECLPQHQSGNAQWPNVLHAPDVGRQYCMGRVPDRCCWQVQVCWRVAACRSS